MDKNWMFVMYNLVIVKNFYIFMDFVEFLIYIVLIDYLEGKILFDIVCNFELMGL